MKHGARVKPTRHNKACPEPVPVVAVATGSAGPPGWARNPAVVEPPGHERLVVCYLDGERLAARRGRRLRQRVPSPR